MGKRKKQPELKYVFHNPNPPGVLEKYVTELYVKWYLEAAIKISLQNKTEKEHDITQDDKNTDELQKK